MADEIVRLNRMIYELIAKKVSNFSGYDRREAE